MYALDSEEDRKMLAILGKRAEEIANLPEVRQKAFEIYQQSGMDAAQSYIYRLAIGTLCGIGK